jgi:hypothetical protein
VISYRDKQNSSVCYCTVSPLGNISKYFAIVKQKVIFSILQILYYDCKSDAVYDCKKFYSKEPRFCLKKSPLKRDLRGLKEFLIHHM